jgi:hypothetical protein
MTGGSHHAIGTLTTSKQIVEDMIEGIKEDQRSITSMKTLA